MEKEEKLANLGALRRMWEIPEEGTPTFFWSVLWIARRRGEGEGKGLWGNGGDAFTLLYKGSLLIYNMVLTNS